MLIYTYFLQCVNTYSHTRSMDEDDDSEQIHNHSFTGHASSGVYSMQYVRLVPKSPVFADLPFNRESCSMF